MLHEAGPVSDAAGLVAREQRVLERIARGVPLSVVLSELVLAAEAQSPNGMIGSVLLMDRDGGRLLHGAAPSLPDAYNRCIEGIAIGPLAGSCGSAAASGEPVYVEDVMVHPSWAAYRDLAAEHGLRACWSMPIRAADGRVLGTFANYYREPRAPGPRDVAAIVQAAHTAALAIERAGAEQALRQSEAQFRTLADNIDQFAWMAEPNGSIYWYNKRWYDFTGTTFDTMQGWGWQAVHHPDHVAGVAERFATAIDAGTPWEDTFPIRGRDGHYCWFLSRAHPIRDAGGAITHWFGTNTDVTDKIRAEEHQKLLLDELEHRIKNTLAMVQAIARQTLRDGTEIDQSRQAFEARLLALSRAHDVLTQGSWAAAPIAEVVANALSAHQTGGRIDVSGPDLMLAAKPVVALALALHELATNAAKYGALSNETGRVSVTWAATEEAGTWTFRFRWVEAGGPPVAAPSHRGFGSRMIERSLESEFGGTVAVCYEPSGVACRIAAPLSAVTI